VVFAKVKMNEKLKKIITPSFMAHLHFNAVLFYWFSVFSLNFFFPVQFNCKEKLSPSISSQGTGRMTSRYTYLALCCLAWV